MRMKKMLSVVIPAFFLLSIIGCSGIYKMERNDLTPLTLAELKANPSRVKTFYEDIQAGKEILLQVASGDVIPCHVEMDTPLMALTSGDNRLRFSRDVFLCLSAQKMLISPDSRNWSDIRNMKAVKKLFGIREGSISVGLHAAEKDGTFLSIDVTATPEK